MIHTVRDLLCFDGISCRSIYFYPSRSLHWHWNDEWNTFLAFRHMIFFLSQSSTPRHNIAVVTRAKCSFFLFFFCFAISICAKHFHWVWVTGWYPSELYFMLKFNRFKIFQAFDRFHGNHHWPCDYYNELLSIKRCQAITWTLIPIRATDCKWTPHKLPILQKLRHVWFHSFTIMDNCMSFCTGLG